MSRALLLELIIAMWGAFFRTALFSAILIAAACGREAAPKASEPAHVSGHVAETELATVTLTPEAEKRLGVEVAAIEQRNVPAMRTLGGEIVGAAGDASALTRYSATASMSISELAAAQIEAEGAVARAEAAHDAAKARFDRIKRLVAANAESARVRDEAGAALKMAEADLNAARSRRSLLGQSITMTEPAARLWIRASVYTGDLARLAAGAPAQVKKLGSSLSRPATPISAPAAASAASGVSFLVYELDNKDGAFAAGERVEVAIPTNIRQPALTAPWSAILYDVYGGEWVYERVSEHTYARRRVEIAAVVGDTAILTRGPASGAKVVSVGAPELFGTEFGVGH